MRLETIDGLRGIAIALVVAYHSWLVYGYNAGVLSQAGFLGVELFFALSGFCMFFPYARARFNGERPPSWGTYAYRRAIKIVPSYVFALTVFAALYAQRDGTNQTALAYVAHLFFLHPFFSQQFQSISGPLWTIGVEVQFYLVFPILCGLFLHRPAIAAALTIAISCGYRLAFLLAHHDPGFFWANQVVAFLDVFAAGILAAYAVAWYRSHADGTGTEQAATFAALAAGAAAVLGFIAFSHSSAMQDTVDFFAWQMRWRLLIAALLFVLITGCTLALPQLRRLVANPACTFLAVISYNLYLWHLEILAFGQRTQLDFALALLAAVAVAAATTYLIERPLMQAKALRRLYA